MHSRKILVNCRQSVTKGSLLANRIQASLIAVAISAAFALAGRQTLGRELRAPFRLAEKPFGGLRVGAHRQPMRLLDRVLHVVHGAPLAPPDVGVLALGNLHAL